METMEIIKKFNNYIRNCIKELNAKKSEITLNIECARQISVISAESSIDELIAIKSYVLRIEPRLLNDYKIIEFFNSKNKTNVPQVNTAVNNILAVINEKRIINTKDLENQIKLIDKTILEYNNYLVGNRFSIKMLFELLENSKMSLEEQIIILSDMALKISPSVEIKQVDNEEKVEPVHDDNDIYLQLLAVGKNILVQYYDVLATKTPQEMRDIINISQIIGGMNMSDVRSFYTEKTIYEGLIYKIKTLVNELSESIRKNGTNKEELYIELEDTIELLKGLTLDVGKVQEPEPVKIYFLLDDSGQPLFTMDYYSGDLSKIDSLITRLANTPGELVNGRPIQDNWLDANKINAYVKSFSDMNCSYLNMSDNKILIIEFASGDQIYSRTVGTIRKNQDRINEIMRMVKGNNAEFDMIQRDFLNNFQDNLTGSGR